MRRFILTCILTFQFYLSQAQTEGWQKEPNLSWKGKNGDYYKVDQMCNLQTSKDLKNWVALSDPRWEDKSGKWFRLEKGKVEASVNAFKWEPAVEWIDMNGDSYKLDSDCMLMILRKAGTDKAENK